jgi:hypothetical protein
LSHSNLAGAIVSGANFNNADLSFADTRVALNLDSTDVASLRNTILPDGRINGLDLLAGEELVVRDHDGEPGIFEIFAPPRPPIPITVLDQLAMSNASVLRSTFEADAWDSTISFQPGIPVTLGGTLELDFAAGVNLASQVGRKFVLFDWTGVNPAGKFEVASPYVWDLTNLYTTGEVTLTAIPEPSGVALLYVGLVALAMVHPARDHRTRANRLVPLPTPLAAVRYHRLVRGTTMSRDQNGCRLQRIFATTLLAGVGDVSTRCS